MKRILTYIAIAAFSALPFTNTTAATDAQSTATKPPSTVVTIELAAKAISPQPTVPAATPPQTTIQAAAITPPPSKPAFDPNNPTTWPTCASNEIVWAQDGLCHQKVTFTATQPAVQAAPTVTNYPTDHDSIMAAAGISASDYGYVDYIVSHESGWRTYAAEPSSGAYGLCQSLPAAKMATAGADWATNPVTQMSWCNSYAIGRYGSWAAAYDQWTANQWW